MTHSRDLSRRESQVMDLLFRLGESDARTVQAELPDPPSYSAVRSVLRILVEKGLLTHQQDGQRYLYRPAVETERARRSAMRHLVDTFFGGSAEDLVATLVDEELEEGERVRLLERIEQARQRRNDPEDDQPLRRCR